MYSLSVPGDVLLKLTVSSPELPDEKDRFVLQACRTTARVSNRWLLCPCCYLVHTGHSWVVLTVGVPSD